VLFPGRDYALTEGDNPGGNLVVRRHRDHLRFLALAHLGGGSQPELVRGRLLGAHRLVHLDKGSKETLVGALLAAALQHGHIEGVARLVGEKGLLTI